MGKEEKEDDDKRVTTYALDDLDSQEAPPPAGTTTTDTTSSQPQRNVRFSHELGTRPQLTRLDTTSPLIQADNPEPLTAPASTEPNSPNSPNSPARRNRGMSLRSQMFTRMENRERAERTSSETQPISPVQIEEPPPPAFGPHHTDITEEPIFPYQDYEEPSKKKKLGGSIRTTELLPNYSNWAASSLGTATKVRNQAREAFSKARDFVLRVKHIPPTKNGRIIPVEVPVNRPELIDERTNRPYCSNLITSSIYTPYTFLPRQLVAQFSKLANIYFMAVSILQMIPSWSTTGNYTTIIPLMVFITISMGREGFDDWRRHRQDKTENNRTTRVAELNLEYQNSDGGPEENVGAPIKYNRVPWKDVKVGDVVKLKQNDWIPADIIVLHSAGDQGLAYIETMALDGETNLKIREPPPDLAETCNTEQKLASVKAEVVTEDPNMDLYNFEAKLTIEGRDKVYPLDTSNVVYRGSILRNTPSMHGMVIFSGEESKIRMNAVQNARTKAPRLQKKANNVVIFLVFFVLGLSIFSLVASKVYYSTTGSHMWYLIGLEVGTVPNLMGFIIMYNTLIPLSLYVSMEIVKVCQMLMLQLDVDMYHAESDTPLEAKTATINEELGQVSYIFSDKTGTLTDNVMLFRKFTVAGHSWLHDLDIQMADAEENDKLFHKVDTRVGGKAKLLYRTESTGALSRGGKKKSMQVDYHHQSSPRPSVDAIFQQVANLPRRKSSISTARARPSGAAGRPSVSTWKSTAAPGKVQSAKSTLQLLQYLQTNPHTVYAKKAKFFLLGLALCHACLPETTVDHGEIENVDYQSASPDELALVEAARDLGYIVIDRQHTNMTVRTYPNGFDSDPVDEVYQTLESIEFSSSRKRMSVVVKFPDGRICVFCKGADNVIMERLKQSQLAQNKAEELNQQTMQRKAAEAELVVARNSVSSNSNAPRVSISGVNYSRPSLSLVGRTSMNIDRKQALSSLDTHLNRANKDDGVDQIAESSRRSVTLARQKKYGSDGISVRPSVDFGDSPHSPHPSHSPQSPAAAAATAAQQEYGEYEEELEIDDKLAMNNQYIMERTLEHIEEFSTEGLRTLMYSYRWMDKDEYDNWAKLYHDARTSLENRQEKIEKVGESIERDFELLGATAIEDKLQEGVPEAIDKLRRANIRLWMLTGDKRETAINIGYSCRLIKDYSTVVVLKSDDGDVAGKMAAAMLSLDGGTVAHCVVVIDGMTLTQIEQDMTLMTLFIDLGVKADSVICCRASPAQKSAMVTSVRQKLKSAVCLAIGDGANDIAMIRSADVGIGITGKEGLQAARSSDYSIAQFRFLLKLLLVHGRWNYVRTCKYILGTFYKELLFYLTQAIYQRNAMFTGTSMYENWSLSMFNTLFTSLPVMCVGIMERDLSATTLIAVPELYAKGQQNQGFGLLLFIGWMCVAASQSVTTSFLSYYMYGFTALSDNTMYPLGTLSFTICLCIICTKLQIVEMYTITVVSAATMIISIGGWFCFQMFISYVYSTKPSKIYFVYDALFSRFGRDLSWWAALLIGISIGVLFDVVIQTVRVQAYPSETEIFQQLEHDPQVWRRLQQEAKYELETTNYGHRQELLAKAAKKRGLTVEEVDQEWQEQEVASQDIESQPETPPRKRDKIIKKLRFAPRKTSGEYEREIQEILERREADMDQCDK